MYQSGHPLPPGTPASPHAVITLWELPAEQPPTVQPTWHLKRASWVRAGGRMRVGATAAPGRVGVAAVGRVRERVAVGLLERIRKSGVEWHVRFILS